jgi:hypothetical protein
MWQDILKEVKVLNESTVSENMPNFRTASDKGYPTKVSPLNLVSELNDEGEVLGFTSYKDMGTFFFVGNGYIRPDHTGEGIFGKLLQERNKHTRGKPRITLLNPLDEKSREKVERMAARVGDKVTSYSQVQDIMNKDMYVELSKLPMYRYPVI